MAAFSCLECKYPFQAAATPRRRAFALIAAGVCVALGVFVAVAADDKDSRLGGFVAFSLLGAVLGVAIWFSQPGSAPLRHQCPRCRSDRTVPR